MLKDLILSANGNPELIRQLVSENSCRTKDELARAVVTNIIEKKYGASATAKTEQNASSFNDNGELVW